MDNDSLWEIRQWILKALHDMRSAQCLFAAQPPLSDTAVYHCQQVAEKALKAFLVFQGVAPQKIHLLSPLVEQCVEFDNSFVALRDAAEILTPYATSFRYPGDVLEPIVEDVEEALELAKHIIVFVLTRLPVEISDTVEKDTQPLQ